MLDLNYINNTEKSFKLVKSKFFKKGDVLGFNLYTVNGISNEKVLLLLKGTPITDKIFNFNFIYIEDNDIAIFKDFLSKNGRDITEEKKEIKKYSELLSFIVKIYNDASMATFTILNNPESEENLRRADLIVTFLQDFISTEYASLEIIRDVMSVDYYTHTHSVNVCIYALFFGKYLGLTDNQLKNLGIAALLHDIGKTKLDFNLVNKSSFLNEKEFEVIKKHSEYGYIIAKKIGFLNNDILSGIRNHHEKLNGDGYPDRLTGDKISLFAKIIGICDIFDALSTNKTYREKISIVDALVSMRQNESGKLDPHILNQFILMFKTQKLS